MSDFGSTTNEDVLSDFYFIEGIVERHGGDIWVDSETGEGATFILSAAGETDE